MPNSDDLLSVQQVAALLQRSGRAVLRDIERGRITATKLPGRTGAYVIRRADLEASHPAATAVSR
jgi:excisionase family DNA binding protein